MIGDKSFVSMIAVGEQDGLISFGLQVLFQKEPQVLIIFCE
jgi:hypothetical protein